jgi:hypothetical protein
MLAPYRKIGGFGKYWQIPKILADFQIKYWRISKILADFQSIGGFPKYWRISKIFADSKIQAPAENQAALLFRLGGISSC